MIVVISWSAREQNRVSQFRLQLLHCSLMCRSSGSALCDMSNLWFYGACGFVPGLTQSSAIRTALLLKKELILVTWQLFSVALPSSLSKVVVCQVTPMLLRKERNKNMWGGSELIGDERGWGAGKSLEDVISQRVGKLLIAIEKQP